MHVKVKLLPQKLTAIEPAINSSTGLVDVQATFEPEDGAKLLSGMFTRLNVALPTEHNQIVVPQVAVSYNMYGESLYILTALSDEDIEKLGGAEKSSKYVPCKINHCIYERSSRYLCTIKRR